MPGQARRRVGPEKAILRPSRHVEVKLADAERRQLSVPSYCVFCEIIADRAPAKVRYLDEDIIVIVNTLNWVPLMLLVIPKKHIGQMEMWCSDLMPRLGDVAVEMGCTYAPNGFRILSNFGRDGMQSQGHSHLHVIGGTSLGPYA